MDAGRDVVRRRAVETAVEGPAAQVDAYLGHLVRGPRHARVTAVEVHDEPSEDLPGFEVEP